MLGVVGLSVKMVKFFMQHLWMLHDVLVVWPGSCNNVAPEHAHYLDFQLATCCNMSQHVATGWPNACNMLRPTRLRSVALKCCDRLAGACKCFANNVGICCVEMSRSFDQQEFYVILFQS